MLLRVIVVFSVSYCLLTAKNPKVKYSRHTLSVDGDIIFKQSFFKKGEDRSLAEALFTGDYYAIRYFVPRISYSFQPGKYGGFLSQLYFCRAVHLQDESEKFFALCVGFGGFLDIAKIPVLRSIDVFFEYISPFAWIFKAVGLFDKKNRRTLASFSLVPFYGFGYGFSFTIDGGVRVGLKHGFYYSVNLSSLSFKFGKDFDIGKSPKVKKKYRIV